MKTANEPRLKTILVVQDVSDGLGTATSPAMEYAQSIALANQSVLVLLHSIDPVGYAFPQGAPEDAWAGSGSKEELACVEEKMRAQHFPAHSVTETEVVYQRILQAVKDYRADLLVLGTHVASPLGRLALATVATQLLHGSPCPVMCVPAQDAAVPLPEEVTDEVTAFTGITHA